MKFELKAISTEAIPEALAKVDRYRLLGEPSLAQSICEGILRVEPDNQDALIMLLLSITDQLERGTQASEARALLPRLTSEYHKAYYAGIISERAGKALLVSGPPGSHYTAYELFREAMRFFENAEKIRPAGNDDAILRWNTCARTMMRNPSLQARTAEPYQEVLGE